MILKHVKSMIKLLIPNMKIFKSEEINDLIEMLIALEENQYIIKDKLPKGVYIPKIYENKEISINYYL